MKNVLKPRGTKCVEYVASMEDVRNAHILLVRKL